MSERICAVVVTHNRLTLLQECIESLRNQTRSLDEIIVVNNDSKDGTKEWLNNQKDLTSIHQENLGGAGGFYNGIKAAYEMGYDWIWCMDDDCLPTAIALQQLLDFRKNDFTILNSFILSKTNKFKINFGFFDYAEKVFYDNIDQVSGKTFLHGAGFFNGTLFSRKAVAKVGLPNPKLFIYGDEYEYYLRYLKNDIDILTVTSSIVYHPEQRYKYFGKGKLFYRFNYLNDLGVKYFPRNIMAIWYYYEEFTFRKLVKTYFCDLAGLLFIQKKIGLVLKYVFAILSGVLFTLKNEIG